MPPTSTAFGLVVGLPHLAMWATNIPPSATVFHEGKYRIGLCDCRCQLIKCLMRKTILILAAVFASGLLFVNVYTSVVDAQNWGHDIPNSLMAAREYFSVANPGTFFRVASPTSQVLALLALIICWNSPPARGGVAPASGDEVVGGWPRVRIYCAAALVLAVSVDLFTFAYFYPRNDIMFVAPLTTDTEALKTAWSGWTTMNWPRSGILAAQVIIDHLALMRVAKSG